MKKTLLTLIMVLALVLTSCTVTLAEAPAYKIGIMTPLASSSEEEYSTAERIVAQYPDIAIHVTFPENASNDIETTISTALSLAYDEDVKAIVISSAYAGSAAAVKAVKEIRPDVLCVVGIPQEDISVICSVADVVFRQNVTACGTQIADAVKEMGCEYVVHYSFARHMASQAIVARSEAMAAECEKIGINYLYVETPDPSADTGRAYSQQFVLEKCRELAKEYDNKVAFFSSNIYHIEPMITAALETGAYYTMPSDPSPFTGIPSALGLSVADEYAGDAAYMLEQISAKLAEKGQSGHMFNWSVPVGTLCVQAAFEYAHMFCEGETNGMNDAEALKVALNKFANVELSAYADYESGETVDNFYNILADYVIL